MYKNKINIYKTIERHALENKLEVVQSKQTWCK